MSLPINLKLTYWVSPSTPVSALKELQIGRGRQSSPPSTIWKNARSLKIYYEEKVTKFVAKKKLPQAFNSASLNFVYGQMRGTPYWRDFPIDIQMCFSILLLPIQMWTVFNINRSKCRKGGGDQRAFVVSLFFSISVSFFPLFPPNFPL